MSKELVASLSSVLADTYALYLKSQNYHWHVTGPNFSSLHALFEDQYTQLADAVDKIAERIRTLEAHAPATFTEFNALKSIKDGDATLSGAAMLAELVQDNKQLVKDLYEALKSAQKAVDEGTIALLSERIAAHEKSAWMLSSSL